MDKIAIMQIGKICGKLLYRDFMPKPTPKSVTFLVITQTLPQNVNKHIILVLENGYMSIES